MKRAFLLLVLLLLAGQLIASNAIAAYRSNTGSGTATPKIRFWDTTANGGSGAWSSEIELATAGAPVYFAQVKYSPINQKLALVTLSGDGNLDAYVCFMNCATAGSWTVTNNIGNVWSAAASQRRYDIAFETATGDLLVVYGVVDTDTTHDLAYKVLPGNASSFTGISEQYIDDGSANGGSDLQYSWVALARNDTAGSQNLLAVGFDSTGSDISGWAWSGSAWGNQQEISTSAASTGGGEAIAVAYAADGSKGMIMGADGTVGMISTYYWNGASWANGTSIASDTGVTTDVKWITLKPNPQNDDLQATFVDSGSDLGTAYWNGATWAVTANHDTGLDSNAARPEDFEWNGTNSRGILVRDTDTTGTTITYRNWTGSWGTAVTRSTYAGTGAWLTLYRNPNATETARILGLRLNSNFDIGSFWWNSTSSGTQFANYGDGALTSDTVNSTYEGHSLSFLHANDTTGPTVFGTTVNATSVPPGGFICINASVVDTQANISAVNATVTYPNLTIINFTMSPVTIDNCDAGTATDALFSVLIPAGDTEGTITVNNTFANDSFNNTGFEPLEPRLNVTVSSGSTITTCTNITSGGTYTLGSDITGSGAAHCLIINASGVTVDGMGFTVTGGIHTDGVSNVALSNFVIDPATGLDVKGTSDSNFTNLTITNVTERGIYVRVNSNRNNFTNFSINTTIGGSGIWVEGGVNNTFDCLGRNITRDGNGSCVQETATELTACGGLSTGAYATDDWGGEEGNLYDGDWSTSATNPGGTANMYVNYTLPASAILATSIWQVKYGEGDSTITANQTIPADCWNQGLLQFQVISEPGTQETFGNCWDGTQWLGIWSSSNQGGGEDGRFYEEALWWGFETRGVFAAQNGTTVKNCSIGGFTHAAWLEQANQSTLYNNTMHDGVASGFNHATGIMLNRTSFANSTANIIYSHPGYGVFLNVSTSDNFTGNVVYNSSLAGFHLESSDSNLFTNDSSHSNAQQGFRLSTSAQNSFTRAAAYKNSQYGFELSASTYNSLADSLSYNNTLHGVYAVVSASNYNTLRNVTSNDNGGYGLYDSQGSFNNFSYTYAANNSEGGVYIIRATNNFLNQTALQLNWKTALEITHSASTGNNFTGVSINTTGSSHGVYVNGGTGTYLDCASGWINGTGNGTACLQDQSNISTLCGGIPNGKYACEGVWAEADQPCYLAIDGDWGTFGWHDDGADPGGLSTVFINYTKPSAATPSSIWQRSTGSAGEQNTTIDSNCWAQQPLQFKIESDGGIAANTGYCWDGTQWVQLWQEGETQIYEEAMWWDVQPMGIYSALENTTVLGCSISGFYTGLNFTQANGTISHSSSHGNWLHGFYFSSSNSNTLSNDSAYLNNGSGFYFLSSSSNSISSSESYSNTANGFLLDTTAENNSLYNLTAYKNIQYGIYISTASRNNITNSTASNNIDGIRVISSDYVQLYGSRSENNSQYGFRLQSNQYNNYTLNRAYNNSIDGFYLNRVLFVQDDFNLITNNTAYNNSGNGFRVDSNTNVPTLANNTAYNNRLSGFNISNIEGAVLANNTAYGNLESAFYLSFTSSNFTGNNATSAQKAAVNLSGTTTSIFSNNSINGSSFSLYLSGASTTNNFTNNTLLSATGTLLYLDSSSNGNRFWWNNFSSTSGPFVNDTNGLATPNFYNISNVTVAQGNIWQDVVNGSVNIISIGKYPALVQGFYYGDSGTGYPYNNTTALSGRLYGNVVDRGPLTTLLAGCQNLTANYTLTGNVSSTGGICFSINAANVTLNCTGYYIVGPNTTGSIGVYSNQYATTVRDCKIANFSEGIKINHGTDSLLYNNTINTTFIFGNSTHILNGSNRSNILANYIWGRNSTGIWIETESGNATVNCSGLNITGSNATATYGIATSAFNTTVSNCTILGFDYGIYFANQSYNGTAQFNNVTRNANIGIRFVNSSNNTLTSNEFCTNPMDLDNAGLNNTGTLNSCDSFLNYTENSHSGCTFACTSLWHRFFGNVSGSIILGTKNVSPYVYEWTGAAGLNVYMTDYDSAINWTNLQAIGRTASGSGVATTDFYDLDSALSSGSFRDNVSITYSSAGTAGLYNDTFTIYSITVPNVPVFNSSKFNTAFKTGILWDNSSGTEYDATTKQPTVWVVKVNTTQIDVYGNYQYLISIPYTLSTYQTGNDLVAIYAELQ